MKKADKAKCEEEVKAGKKEAAKEEPKKEEAKAAALVQSKAKREPLLTKIEGANDPKANKPREVALSPRESKTKAWDPKTLPSCHKAPVLSKIPYPYVGANCVERPDEEAKDLAKNKV